MKHKTIIGFSSIQMNEIKESRLALKKFMKGRDMFQKVYELSTVIPCTKNTLEKRLSACVELAE